MPIFWRLLVEFGRLTVGKGMGDGKELKDVEDKGKNVFCQWPASSSIVSRRSVKTLPLHVDRPTELFSTQFNLEKKPGHLHINCLGDRSDQSEAAQM
jgi:hypothetical protein